MKNISDGIVSVRVQCPAQIFQIAKTQNAFHDKLPVRVFIHPGEVNIPKQFLFFQCFHKLKLSYCGENGNFFNHNIFSQNSFLLLIYIGKNYGDNTSF